MKRLHNFFKNIEDSFFEFFRQIALGWETYENPSNFLSFFTFVLFALLQVFPSNRNGRDQNCKSWFHELFKQIWQFLANIFFCFFCQIAMVEFKTVHSGFTIFSKNLSFPWKCFPVFFRQIEMVEVKIVHSGFTNFSKNLTFPWKRSFRYFFRQIEMVGVELVISEFANFSKNLTVSWKHFLRFSVKLQCKTQNGVMNRFHEFSSKNSKLLIRQLPFSTEKFRWLSGSVFSVSWRALFLPELNWAQISETEL